MTTVVLENLIGVGEASRLLGVSSERIRQLCNAGELTYLSSPYGRLIRRSSVERLVRERRERTARPAPV